MPKLIWSELDVNACLATMPDVDEFETEYVYIAHREGVVIELRIFPNESVVALSLTPTELEDPVVTITLLVRGSILYKDEPQRDSIVFQDSMVVPGRFYFRKWPDAVDAFAHPFGLDVELAVTPVVHVSIEAAAPPSIMPTFDTTPSRHVIDIS